MSKHGSLKLLYVAFKNMNNLFTNVPYIHTFTTKKSLLVYLTLAHTAKYNLSLTIGIRSFMIDWKTLSIFWFLKLTFKKYQMSMFQG